MTLATGTRPAPVSRSAEGAPRTDALAPTIRLVDISRIYRVGSAEVRALDGVTLTVERGEYVAVMGPSGSGKSTLLQVMGCLDSPSSGRYELDGEAVEALSEDRLAEVRRRKIGFVFQSYHLLARMTAARNVELPLVLAGVEPSERRSRVRAALDSVGLSARLDHRPDQMSGGERQRVAIARAIVTRPRLLLADEPTGNLDTRTGEEIIGVIEQLNRGGLTVVLVTHDPAMGERAERVLRMRDGRLMDDSNREVRR